ncbi:MAG: S-formylglutathione hydrolase [Thiotrichaceae bacterium]|nr:S-formylglutathione hydrolase [Thiotrichaceae bacterium]
MQEVEKIKEFGGWLKRYTHNAFSCQCAMTFSIFLPPLAEKEDVPAVYWLSGLTCTDDNFRTKAGAQRYASELGIALIIPDTSPRGDNVADEEDRYDLGKGAGFYVNATQAPWSKHYQMYDYVTKELPALIEENFPVIKGLRSISGHSMGGHGALICGLKNAGMYRSVSAFAPINNPVKSGWGKGCFSAYLGDDVSTWEAYDATCLVKAGAKSVPILIDHGQDDQFLVDQLHPEHLLQACRETDQSITLRMHEGYDHSYHFIATYIGEHLAFHEKALRDR